MPGLYVGFDPALPLVGVFLFWAVIFLVFRRRSK